MPGPSTASLECETSTPLQEDKWELYNTNEDFSLSNDLAAKDPEKLKDMQDLFMKEAKNTMYCRSMIVCSNGSMLKLMGRPTMMEDRTSVTYGEGMKGMGVDIFIDLRNTSYTITAEVEVDANGNGVIVCQGGRFGGLSFYLKDGKPAFTYNYPRPGINAYYG